MDEKKTTKMSVPFIKWNINELCLREFCKEKKLVVVYCQSGSILSPKNNKTTLPYYCSLSLI